MKPAARSRSTAASRPSANSSPWLRAYDTVHEAEKLRQAGKLEKGERLCLALLKEYPDYLAALQTLGLVLADKGQHERALEYLHRASMLAPNDTRILTALSGVYLRLESPLMAARTLEQARKLAPNDANILATLGEIYREQQEYELSKDAFEAALKVDPAYYAAELGLASNLVQIGQLDEAAKILERMVRQGSRVLRVLYLLSEMPTDLVTLDILGLLEDESTANMAAGDGRVAVASLAFTKAAALDKAGRYDEAWTALREARRYRYARNRKDYQDVQRNQTLLLNAAKSIKVRLKGDVAGNCPVSLFIVGTSRSGKTSLERLVGTLEGVKKGYENPIIANATRLAFQTSGLPTRSNLIELPPGLGDVFEEFYVDELKKRAGSAATITNTLPGRVFDALRVAEVVPNARFIFVKRNVEDTCLRIYMRNYKSGNAHASDLRDVKGYVTWCHEMIDVMAAKMPKVARVVSYEEMVDDPRAALQVAADLCGLRMHHGALPQIGDDRGCAAPYRELIKEALNG